MKRLFDILLSSFFLTLLLPLFLVIAVLIALDSKGGVIFRQIRVGKDNIDFYLLKFRTMKPHSESKGMITIGDRDSRITKIGFYLRKTKLDEVPQLWNVLKGEMSFVGPRPEVRKYVDIYTKEQRQVLSIKPGITDLASLEYIDENKLLGEAADPEETYINEILPHKLKLALKYKREHNFLLDLKIIGSTLKKVLRSIF